MKTDKYQILTYLQFKNNTKELMKEIFTNEILNSNTLNEEEKIQNLIKLEEGLIGWGFHKILSFIRFFIAPKFRQLSAEIENSEPMDENRIELMNNLRQKYLEIQNRYNELKDQPGREDEKEQLIKDTQELKDELDVAHGNFSKVKELNNQQEELQQDIEPEIEEPEIENMSISEPNNLSIQPDKMNYGVVTSGSEMEALQSWQKWYNEKCVGKTENVKQFNYCKSKGCDFAIGVLYRNMYKCSKTNNSNKCRQSLMKLIYYWKNRKNEYLRS